VFDLFIKSDEIVETFRQFEGKCLFFETAEKRDPNNPYVLQHYARMLLREKKLSLAMAQIDKAIDKDHQKSIRILHHTRAMIMSEQAMTEENLDVARKWMARAEQEFQYCIVAKEIDSYGHSGLASLFLGWAKKIRASTDEATEYLEKAETVITEGLKVVRDSTPLLIISAEIQREIGDEPARLEKLREAVNSDHASVIGRFLLARTYLEQGKPEKTVEILGPTVKNDFGQVRAYVVYVKAMLALGEPFKKCSATLSQCRLDGATDPAFVGLYGGLLFVGGSYEEAKKVFDDAREQNFTYDERYKRQFDPRDAAGGFKRIRYSGVVKSTKPSFIFIQPNDGPDVISATTSINGTQLKKGDKVEFYLTFSAKGPLAEILQIVA
jgi:predicted Zn-dependent protease/cold shock CspA family protein